MMFGLIIAMGRHVSKRLVINHSECNLSNCPSLVSTALMDRLTRSSVCVYNLLRDKQTDCSSITSAGQRIVILL